MVGYSCILTSTIVTNVWLGTETTFLITANRVSWTLVISRAVNSFGTLDKRIRLWYVTSGTLAIK